MVTLIQVLSIFYDVIQEILSLYWWVVILAAVFSNLIAFGIIDSRNRLVWTVTDFLYRITEPALRRIRRYLPSFGGVDLSPLVLLLGITVVQRLFAVLFPAFVQAVL